MSRNRLIVLGFVVVLAGAIAAWLLLGPNQSAPDTAGNPGYVITARDRTIGNPKAKVVLIEYGAPVCPHCAEFEMQDFPHLKADYIDTGKVFYVFRVFPIRPLDFPAENIARCLPEDKYFAFIDLLFRNQPKWDGDEYPVADPHAGLVLMGRIAGMTPEQVDTCIADKAGNELTKQVGADADAKYHITGTPTFVVNGSAMAAGAPYSDLKNTLDAELAKK